MNPNLENALKKKKNPLAVVSAAVAMATLGFISGSFENGVLDQRSQMLCKRMCCCRLGFPVRENSE